MKTEPRRGQCNTSKKKKRQNLKVVEYSMYLIKILFRFNSLKHTPKIKYITEHLFELFVFFNFRQV